MSQILFLCSGNTCRSPMAARIAERVFGASHSISSAGAETVTGEPAASHAITALREMAMDLSGHTSVDVQDLDLSRFDLVVIFCPSRGEFVPIPKSARVAYIDLEDPHGGDLNVYRAAARKILREVRVLHCEDALHRGSSPSGPRGSHLEGILNRAMKGCEAEIADFIARKLGQTVSHKAPLGQLVGVIRDVVRERNRSDLVPLVSQLAGLNEVWMKVKHFKTLHLEPGYEEMMETLKTIQRTYPMLEK